MPPKNPKYIYPRIGLFLLLLLVFAFFVSTTVVHGQLTPHATYESHIKVGSDGNGTVSVIYSVFAGDQSLQLNAQILFPIYNSTTIDENSMKIHDLYGQSYTWRWSDYSNKSIIVTIGPLNIAAGGKYEIDINYDQSFLCKIVNSSYYFVYEWDFSQIGQTPYVVTQYSLAFERPADGLLDSYPVTYVGPSPTTLINYMTQSGATIAFDYTFSISDVTLNVYFNHLYGPSTLVVTTIAFALLLAVALYIIIRRSRT